MTVFLIVFVLIYCISNCICICVCISTHICINIFIYSLLIFVNSICHKLIEGKTLYRIERLGDVQKVFEG